jgi:ribosomal subunit interface protein
MLSTQIALKNVRRSTALQGRIAKMREHLDRYHPHILACRVGVDESSVKEEGPQFAVNVAVRVPGREFVANRFHDEDVYLALHEAFDAVRRQLLEASGSRRDRQRRKSAKRNTP